MAELATLAAAAVAVIAAWFAVAAARRLAAMRAVLVGIQDELAALDDAVTVNRTMVKRISSREHRRDQAAARNGGDELPDPRTHPDDWKRAMRARMKAVPNG